MEPVILSGIVKPYAGNGREFGYPTANISVQTELEDGIYFGYANLSDYLDRPALIFVGVPVTVGDSERRVEVHLLDIPDVDYYELPLVAQVQHFHRGNQKFESIAELLVAMKDDDQAARAWFVHNPLA